MAPSAHLLRTLAAVAPSARVVDVACGAGRHLGPLARLGFDVWGSAQDPASVEASRAALADVFGAEAARQRVTPAAPDALGYPDAWCDWAVVAGVPLDALPGALAEAARVLRPGAWVWAESADRDALTGAASGAGLVVAEAPAEEDARVHAVFRRPGGVG